jgi:uncharacterized membrane protein YhaH (DUF805 family)
MTTNRLEGLFGKLDTPLKRVPYAAAGFSLAILKYVVDAGLIAYGTGVFWRPFDYLDTVHSLLLTRAPHVPYWLTLALMLWLVPFVAIGVFLTMRRALDAGWSPWWSLVFFVPYANYVLMAALCLWPSSDKYALTERGREQPHSNLVTNSVTGVIAGVLFGLLMVGTAVVLKGNYAFGLFIGTPVGMGAVAGYFLSRGYEPEFNEILAVVALMLGCIAGALLLMAFEGLVCIAMAFPFAFVFALFGAMVGREIARGGRAIRRSAASAMILIPVFTLVEPANLTGNTLHEVKSSVVIDAAPGEVWPHVIAFSPMAAPTEWKFRLGLAYPRYAHIEGSGIGAVRYCEFSTGPFVEPITAWEPAKRLAFDVRSSPDPLKELSLYENVEPRHLRGYVRSKRGEFRLIALPGGRTRLEGSTWYELQMAPEAYWSLWVDSTIHDIHDRVLEHIKSEVESTQQLSAK